MKLNKVSVFSVRLLSTELQVPAYDTADELSYIQFHFYMSSCCYVSWGSRQIKSGCPRNILEVLSLFITFFEEHTGPVTSSLNKQTKNKNKWINKSSQTSPGFAEGVNFPTELLYCVIYLEVKLSVKLLFVVVSFSFFFFFCVWIYGLLYTFPNWTGMMNPHWENTSYMSYAQK